MGKWVWAYNYFNVKSYDDVINILNFKQFVVTFMEVRNSWVTKSSYETELRKMTWDFQLLTQKCLQKLFFRVTNSTS